MDIKMRLLEVIDAWRTEAEELMPSDDFPGSESEFVERQERAYTLQGCATEIEKVLDSLGGKY